MIVSLDVPQGPLKMIDLYRKKRVQAFKGIVCYKHFSDKIFDATITIRKMSPGGAVEKCTEGSLMSLQCPVAAKALALSTSAPISCIIAGPAIANEREQERRQMRKKVAHVETPNRGGA